MTYCGVENVCILFGSLDYPGQDFFVPTDFAGGLPTEGTAGPAGPASEVGKQILVPEYVGGSHYTTHYTYSMGRIVLGLRDSF